MDQSDAAFRSVVFKEASSRLADPKHQTDKGRSNPKSLPGRNMLFAQARLLALWSLALCCTGLVSVLAWGQSSSPVLSVAPAIPTPSDNVQLTIMQVTGFGASIDSSAVTVQGSTIEIDAKITFSTYYVGGAVYTLAKNAGTLSEGRYAVRYVTQTRQFTPDYGQPTLLAEWELVVLAPGKTVTAIEYYWPIADHYFLTAIPAEINALDTGVFPGWVRTGQSYGVVASSELGNGFGPVCRFYGKPEAGLNSHFYSASPDECAAVLEKFSAAWLLESSNVFQTYLPDIETGICPSGLLPVYRLYNNRSDVNHRYTTSLIIKQQMIAAGWLPEGYGPDAVVWCAIPQ